ncbi:MULTISPECIES: hypothetical protein [Micromonospora]|uniref:Uncharacterized protein n=1 Tax=Micromonospora maris TaxID=1003110 RepID=A0A9X0LEN4_9ACTN|nr:MULTISPECIES: hypothetical protein [Micromonospora]AEB42137.1 hypothetical protein VAB18032_05055 [Micromonospora maris AB-18-032]KUJ47659.1 hypothetical protein ADL17_00560 [Micromonospora maris]RUL91469.1 hypothetical protein EG812_19310 [Verrucosispora sp. FIM060022]
MATPQTPYEAVLHAARDVTKLDTALDAEMLGAALLGSVYEVAETDRETAVREFVAGFLAATSRRRALAATTVRAVFAALVPDAKGADRVRPGAAAPAWSGHLGRVHLTGTWAYGDVYGDQTSYLATFAYDDTVGGPEHALIALVDHNIGIAKDVFVGGPASRILAQVRQLCAEDELTWFREEDPSRMRGEVSRHLAVTDHLGQLPGTTSLATDRALVGARLTILPAWQGAVPVPSDDPLPAAVRADEIRRFLASPEAKRAGFDDVDGAELASLHFCLGLLLDHAATFADADPLRWSPTVAGFFLLDWVHRRAVLDMDDAAMLPRVLRAWAAYAARRRGLPETAAAGTDTAIAEMVPEFVRLYATGERRSPATAAVAQLMADGVDPDDPAALDAWIDANRHRLSDDS